MKNLKLPFLLLFCQSVLGQKMITNFEKRILSEEVLFNTTIYRYNQPSVFQKLLNNKLILALHDEEVLNQVWTIDLSGNISKKDAPQPFKNVWIDSFKDDWLYLIGDNEIIRFNASNGEFKTFNGGLALYSGPNADYMLVGKNELLKISATEETLLNIGNEEQSKFFKTNSGFFQLVTSENEKTLIDWSNESPQILLASENLSYYDYVDLNGSHLLTNGKDVYLLTDNKLTHIGESVFFSQNENDDYVILSFNPGNNSYKIIETSTGFLRMELQAPAGSAVSLLGSYEDYDFIRIYENEALYLDVYQSGIKVNRIALSEFGNEVSGYDPEGRLFLKELKSEDQKTQRLTYFDFKTQSFQEPVDFSTIVNSSFNAFYYSNGQWVFDYRENYLQGKKLIRETVCFSKFNNETNVIGPDDAQPFRMQILDDLVLLESENQIQALSIEAGELKNNTSLEGVILNLGEKPIYPRPERVYLQYETPEKGREFGKLTSEGFIYFPEIISGKEGAYSTGMPGFVFNDIDYMFLLTQEHGHQLWAMNSIKQEEETLLSIEDIEQGITLFPNPVSKKLHIDSDKFTTYSIFDLQGKLLEKNELRGSSVDLQNLMQGVYILKLNNTAGDIIQKRFVKQ